jgi:Cu-processing system permease protein
VQAKTVYSVAKKEFLDNYRNKWIMAVAAIFLILTLVISYFSTRGDVGWKDLDVTIGGMMSLVQFLVPIIALMLSYATIVGEQEKGSLALLLSYPVKRDEVILGKFFGLSSVLAVATLIGFGVSGLIIAVNVKDVRWSDYFIFILSSILVGIVYIALAILASCILKKRSTALGMAIFMWFLFAMIWNIILFGALVGSHGFDVIGDEDWVGPNWYYVGSIINPLSAFSILVALNVGPISADIAGEFPSFYTTGLSLLILSLWIILPLIIAFFRFSKKDL